MLFKLVVITVLVIAESADTCIKTVSHLLIYIFVLDDAIYFTSLLTWNILQILRNCKVARILPRIVDTAKNDRSAILRAR
jgi:CLIP-associating protein 1/2